jgi:hypothetical protein
MEVSSLQHEPTSEERMQPKNISNLEANNLNYSGHHITTSAPKTKK